MYGKIDVHMLEKTFLMDSHFNDLDITHIEVEIIYE